mgnify:CR=1 FL=1
MPVKSFDIARALGFKTSKEINPTLYKMERSGIVAKCGEEMSMWILNSDGRGLQQTAPLNDPGIVEFAMARNEPWQYPGATTQESEQVQSFNDQLGSIKCESTNDNYDNPSMGGGDLSSPITGAYAEEEMDVNMEQISPLCQSTPLVSSPNDNLSVECRDTPASPGGDDVGDSLDKNIDKVLKVLLVNMTCPGASFIIAKKCAMNKTETENCLQRCAELEYVSISPVGSDYLYELTEKGKKYITSKLGKGETMKTNTVQQIRAPIRVKKEFMGPPPEPASLVGNPNSKFFNHKLVQNEQTTKSSGEELSRNKGFISEENSPKQLMSIKVRPVNTLSLASFASNPGTSFSSMPPSLNTGNLNFNFQSRGGPLPFGLGRGRGVRNISPDFVRPQPPVEIIRRQLNQTDLSSSSDKDTFSDSDVNKGIQKLLAQSQQQLTQPGRSNVFNNAPYSQPSFQSSGPQSLGLPMRASDEDMDQQPRSLPLMRTTRLESPFLPSSLDLNSESFAALNKNPVSALMEYAQSRHQEAEIRVISQSGPSHKPR